MTDKGTAIDDIKVEVIDDNSQILDIMKHIKDAKGTNDNKIIEDIKDLNKNNIDVFYSTVNNFITDLNNTNNISKELNSIFNASNDAEINMLNQEIITTFNNVNSNKTDVFYKSLNAFITDLNNTNNISKELNNIFNTANDAKLNELNQEIINTFNNDMQKSTKWLEYYFAMEIELKRAMKPDPMIAYRLGKVATFLPNIGIGDVKNKMGDVMKQMKPDFSIPNFPSVSGMLPPQDYSNLDFDVYLDGDDNDKKYHILSEGKPIKTV